jgi:hypothetical protein
MNVVLLDIVRWAGTGAGSVPTVAASTNRAAAQP